MKHYHFKKILNTTASWTYFLLPGLYFIIMSIIIYRIFGLESILFYVAEGVLLSAMFWGFLDGFRTLMSIIILGLIFVHFMIGNILASALFLITPFLLFNMRDMGAIAIVGMVLLIPYTLFNSEIMIRETPRTEMAKLYSSILFNYPKYTLKSSRTSILMDMITDSKLLDIRLKYHIIKNPNKDKLEKWKLTDGYENPTHPEYERYNNFLQAINKNKNKNIEVKESNTTLRKETISCKEGNFQVIANTLTIRKKPQKDSMKIGLVSKDDKICASIKKEGWVYSDKHEGWLSLSFLK
jgi:hypothetical protein